MKQVVLLVNLGSPENCDVKSIRQFLKEFLSDKRVVGLPKFLWYPILHGVILPFRAKKLLHKYQQIWLNNGKSPLIHYTNCQTIALNKVLDGYDVYSCFSYGKQNIHNSLDVISKKYLGKYQLTILPLYPQYSSSTTASVFDKVNDYFKQSYYIPQIQFINSFASNNYYINALANKLKNHWDKFCKNKLVVSFHSVPQKMIDCGDAYQKECEQTFQLLCNKLDIAERDAILCYQSKFGNSKWIGPSTESVIKQLAKSGQKSIDVICPGFVSDCLETLEEIQIQYTELFKANGGKELKYIPCFNDDIEFINVLKNIITGESICVE
ncbi:MAG: ferrochelatase [Neisseriaceae bacterium]|nr:MAG: ferrochelatase [Neisseriaceae bacterium]